MTQTLEKLWIRNRDSNEVFAVMYNPTSYTIDLSNTWEEKKRPRQKSELQFTVEALRTVSMELFSDTSEAGRDVRAQTDRITALMSATVEVGESARPPILELSWGGGNERPSGFPRKCVLTKCALNYQLFSRQGFPVRAKMSVSFREFVNVDPREEQEQQGPPAEYVVGEGNSLRAIAFKTTGDPGAWKQIAEANDLKNPSRLEQGQKLIIPARAGAG